MTIFFRSQRLLKDAARILLVATALAVFALSTHRTLSGSAPSEPAGGGAVGPAPADPIREDGYVADGAATARQQRIAATPVQAGTTAAFVGSDPRIEVSFLVDGRYDGGLPEALVTLSGEPGYDGTFEVHACQMAGEYTLYCAQAGWNGELLYFVTTPAFTSSTPPEAVAADPAIWQAYVDSINAGTRN